MMIEKIKLLLGNFPKKHSFSLIIGVFLLLSVTFLSNSDLDQKDLASDLDTAIQIEELVVFDEKKEIIIPVIRETIVKRNDSLYSILKRLKVNEKNIVKVINAKNSKLLSNIQVGNKIKITLDEDNKILDLEYSKDFQSGVSATLKKNSYEIKNYEYTPEIVNVYKTVTIKESMYSAGLKAEIPDSVIMDLVYINGWDIDFTHDIRPGDSYSLVYEEILIDGEKKVDGNILIAEFISQGKIFTSIRYDISPGKSEYFTPEGGNVKKAFLRSPVKLSYVSSKYNLKRKHPILHTIRSHNGVDYAAKRGSPIRSTGDGTVFFVGVNGGCGNEIEIKHSEDYSTRYCHLEKFNSKVKKGKKIRQGQIIGYVGSSGLATGPHLHYEFHVNGKHVDPLRVKFPNAEPINQTEKKDYLNYAKKILSSLKNYQTLTNTLVSID